MSPSEQRRVFVLDTNVLLHNAHAIEVFDEHEVVIPFTVLGELDKFKKDNTDVGRNARQVIRFLDRIRQTGKLSDGVAHGERGGTVRVAFFDEDALVGAEEGHPHWFREDMPDNRIIGVAWILHRQGLPVTMISKDINVRLKSDALGIRTEDFENAKVDTDRLSTGYVEAIVPDASIDQLYTDKHVPMENLNLPEEVQQELKANHFLVMHGQMDSGHSGLARCLADTGELVPVTRSRRPVFGVMSAQCAADNGNGFAAG